MGKKRTSFYKGFRNPHQKKISRGLIHLLLWQIGYYNDPHPLPKIPKDFVFPNPQEAVNNDQPKVMWVNHSTFLIQIANKNFLIDPIWNKRCSPFPFFGPKRSHSPGTSLKQLPEIDYVMISHNHYDHLDRKTVCYLANRHKKITWIVPRGVQEWFSRYVPEAMVFELDWWDSVTIEDPPNREQLKFTAVPAQHFSGRGVLDRNKSLWMGCVVELSQDSKTFKRFYYAGDTGYNPYDFKKIGEHFGPMDLSLIPIGVYAPRKFMRPVHVHPSEAVAIHQEVESHLSIGSHFGTFRLSKESFFHPPFDLYKALQDARIPFEQFRVLNPGQVINW